MLCSSAEFWAPSFITCVMDRKEPTNVPLPEGEGIVRFTARERAVHWLVALTFLYTALTGLALWSPRLYWIASIFGGGTTVRAWHPWSGTLFVLIFSGMFIAWNRQMRLDSDDRRWLRRAHRYA